MLIKFCYPNLSYIITTIKTLETLVRSYQKQILNLSQMFSSNKNIEQQQSTVFSSNMDDKRCMTYIEQLLEQNKYKSQALKTAQSLIKSYKKNNKQLKQQVSRLKQKYSSVKNQVEGLYRSNQTLKNQCSKLKDMYKNRSQNRQHSQQIQRLSLKLEQMIKKQEIYQEKIIYLEHKIVILSRSTTSIKRKNNNFSESLTLQNFQNTSNCEFQVNNQKTEMIKKQVAPQNNIKNNIRNFTKLTELRDRLKNKDESWFPKKQKSKSKRKIKVLSQSKGATEHISISSQTSEKKKNKSKNRMYSTPKSLKVIQKRYVS